jgi:hypothetical protein
MAQYSSRLHAVAAQQEADVKKNESVAASSTLEFNSTEPTASNPSVLHCSKRFAIDTCCANYLRRSALYL